MTRPSERLYLRQGKRIPDFPSSLGASPDEPFPGRCHHLPQSSRQRQRPLAARRPRPGAGSPAASGRRGRRATARRAIPSGPGPARDGRATCRTSGSPPASARARRSARCSPTPTSTSGSRPPPGSTAATRTRTCSSASASSPRSSPPRSATTATSTRSSSSGTATKAATQQLVWSHEHYCAGHLIQAAVAQVRCTGDRELLDVAIKLADHLVATFGDGKTVGRRRSPGDRDGPGRAVPRDRDGGLPRPGRSGSSRPAATGSSRNTATSRRTSPTGSRSARRPRWRATRSGPSTSRPAPPTSRSRPATPSCSTRWRRSSTHMWSTKTYLTGGLGARWEGEAFGDEYELPPDRAYAETCAAIGGIQWAWRMLLATGDASLRRCDRADALQRLPRRRLARAAPSTSTSTRCSCAAPRTPTTAAARRTAGAAGSTARAARRTSCAPWPASTATSRAAATTPSRSTSTPPAR